MKPKKQTQKETASSSTKLKPMSKPIANIRVTVLQAELLYNIEEGNSKMDTFVKVKYVDEQFNVIWEHQTKVDLDSGQHPKWNQGFDVMVRNFDYDLLFELWEWDQNSSNDYFGACKVSMQAALQHDGNPFDLDIMWKGKIFGKITVCVDELKRQTAQEDHFSKMMQDENVKTFFNYLNQTGLENAFKLIYAEIITKKIHQNDVYTYTAVRLRQIGSDLKPFLQPPPNKENLLANISEVKNEDNENNQLQ